MASSQSEHRRQAMLDKQRQEMLSEFDRQRENLVKETEKARPSTNRFTTQTESIEETLKKQTIGLVYLDDFQKKRKELEELKAREAAQTSELKEETKKKKKKKTGPKSTLSFAMDEEEQENSEVGASTLKKRKNVDSVAEGEEKEASPTNGNDEPTAASSSESQSTKKARFMKNPNVDTSFLPDRDREEEERRMREHLRREWLKNQEIMKKEEIEITYSYWDGSGHRKVVKCLKGDNIGTFLEKCRQQLPELRGVSVDNMMYIKEDLIIPHHYTFYDFIVNKARGKSGPLFNFDVHDDVRLMADATIEKDESHAGKVVERAWYQRSKHIFPASRWEVFDPEKNYGKYTIA